MSSIEYIVFISLIIAMCIIAKLFAWPLKKIFKLLINIAFGILLIVIINIFGERIGLHIPFNMVTSIIAGTLGIPGVILLVLLNYII